MSNNSHNTEQRHQSKYNSKPHAERALCSIFLGLPSPSTPPQRLATPLCTLCSHSCSGALLLGFVRARALGPLGLLTFTVGLDDLLGLAAAQQDGDQVAEDPDADQQDPEGPQRSFKVKNAKTDVTQNLEPKHT